MTSPVLPSRPGIPPAKFGVFGCGRNVRVIADIGEGHPSPRLDPCTRREVAIFDVLGDAGVLIAWAALPGGDTGGEEQPQPLLDFRPVLANRDVLALIVGYAAASWAASDCGSGSSSSSPSAPAIRPLIPRKPGSS